MKKSAPDKAGFLFYNFLSFFSFLSMGVLVYLSAVLLFPGV